MTLPLIWKREPYLQAIDDRAPRRGQSEPNIVVGREQKSGAEAWQIVSDQLRDASLPMFLDC